MSKIDASAVYPIGAMLHELAAGTPLVIVTADGQRHTGPAEFRVIEGVATLAFDAAPERSYAEPSMSGAIPALSDGEPA